MADKKLSDYLHHYIGGICREVNTEEEFTITPEIYCKIISGELNAKPVLHNWHTADSSFFEGLQKLDIEFLNNFNATAEVLIKYPLNFYLHFPEIIGYLFKQQYDYFGLCNENLAYLNLSTEAANRNYLTGEYANIFNSSGEMVYAVVGVHTNHKK